MIARTSFRMIAALLAACVLLGANFIAHTQTSQPSRGVIRLKVKFKSGDITKELPRKRFFLIKGGLEENRALIEKLRQSPVLSRECYYRGKGASEHAGDGPLAQRVRRIICVAP